VVRTLVAASIMTIAAMFWYTASLGQIPLDMVILAITALLLIGLLIYVGKRKK